MTLQSEKAFLISIHAPRTGSDYLVRRLLRIHEAISIHAPRTGSDSILKNDMPEQMLFQFTLPARGATWLFGTMRAA